MAGKEGRSSRSKNFTVAGVVLALLAVFFVVTVVVLPREQEQLSLSNLLLVVIASAVIGDLILLMAYWPRRGESTEPT